MTLDELIDALQQATGPDQSLDVQIWHVAGRPKTRDYADTPCILCYTASLDAALTLVPEGWCPLIGQNVHHKNWMALVQRVTDDGGIIGPHANGPTPALALCIAALKARKARDE